MYADLPDEILDIEVDDWNNYTLRDEIDQKGEELEAARYKTNPDGDRLEFFMAWSESFVFYYHSDGAFSGIVSVPRNPPKKGDTMDEEY